MSAEISGRVLPTHSEPHPRCITPAALHLGNSCGKFNVLELRGSRVGETGAVLAHGHLCQNFFFFYYSLHWLVFCCKLETEAWGRL